MSDDLDGVLLPAEETLIVETKKRKRITGEVKDAVKKLLSEGKKYKEISETLGISQSSICWIQKENVAANKNLPVEEKKMPMSNDAFLSAIHGAPAAAPVKQDSAALSQVISEFMPMASPEKPKKQPKAAKTKGAGLLAEFMEIDDTVPTAIVSAPPTRQEDKSVLIAKITMNVDTFPEVLRDHVKPDRDGFIAKVAKMSSSDLQHTLGMLEITRSSNNFANQLKYLLYGVSGFVEFGTQKFLGMKTEGYSMMLRQQEAEIQSCLREIAINNIESYKKIEKPEIRLASVLVTTLLATDARNRMEGLKKEFRQQPVSTEEQKEFEHL